MNFADFCNNELLLTYLSGISEQYGKYRYNADGNGIIKVWNDSHGIESG